MSFFVSCRKTLYHGYLCKLLSNYNLSVDESELTNVKINKSEEKRFIGSISFKNVLVLHSTRISPKPASVWNLIRFKLLL